MSEYYQLPKAYIPADTEAKWYAWWENNHLFHGKPNPDKPAYSIVIPPPNVTGILHLGHILNNTLQDILIRHHKMMGYEVSWVSRHRPRGDCDGEQGGKDAPSERRTRAG